MIIVKLMGGLGNQMFQYAMARTIAYRRDLTLKLDISGFETATGVTPRAYELKHLNIVEDFATEENVRSLTGRKSFAQELKRRLLPYYKQPHIREKSLSFDPNMEKVASNVYLEGYWPSEKYFSGIADVIRKEFTIKYPMDQLTAKTAEKIRSCNSVSVHIRRGDYVSDVKTRDFHGLCSLKYYSKAVEFTGSKVQNPHLFVFSDDPDWSKANLNIKYPVQFISHNRDVRHYEDLRLMSICKHNIIANSSFSWWGAWLNSTPGKIVIAPRQWLKDADLEPKDLIPETWHRL